MITFMMHLRLKWMLFLTVMPYAASKEVHQDAPIVATIEGRVIGLQETSTKGYSFYSYYSIPYAKAPVGNLRFKDPVPSPSWEGLLDGRSPPPMCLQVPWTSVTTGNASVGGEEDCLFLNVFTSQPRSDRSHKPVLVYIHGGGFYSGSSSSYPPYALMNEDIVLVTIQYRLGILGFLSTEDELIPGNFGLKDQTEALRWVSRNIHHFGGDPLKVTAFGHSAGAASVHFQMLTPQAKGLFSRGILQSGTALCQWAMGAEHLAVARYTSKILNCPTHPGPEMVTCLQNASGKELVLTLLEYFEWLYLPLLLGPRVDGDYLPDDPTVLMKNGDFTKMDMISGVTSHEGGLFVLSMYARDKVRQALMNDFDRLAPVAMDFSSQDHHILESTNGIFKHYLGGFDVNQDNADDVIKMFTDRHFTVCHDITTMLHARNDKEHKTYRYELDYRGERSVTDFVNLDFGKEWVTHIDDMFYLFAGDVWPPLTRSQDLILRDIFTKLWTNFADTGNPTSDLEFVWNQSTDFNLQYLSVSPNPQMKNDNRIKVRDFFDTLPTRQNLMLQDKYQPTREATQSMDANAKPCEYPRIHDQKILHKPTKIRREKSFANNAMNFICSSYTVLSELIVHIMLILNYN